MLLGLVAMALAGVPPLNVRAIDNSPATGLARLLGGAAGQTEATPGLLDAALPGSCW